MYKKNLNYISTLFRCISLILPLIILLGSIIVFYSYNDDVYIKDFYAFLSMECIYLIFTIILYINSKNKTKTIKKISKIFLIIACIIVVTQFFTIGKVESQNDIIIYRILHNGSMNNSSFEVSGRDLKKIINKVNKMGKGELILSNENIDKGSNYDLYMKYPYINQVIIEKAKSDKQNIGQYDKLEE